MGIYAAENGQRCGLTGGGTWHCAGVATARPHGMAPQLAGGKISVNEGLRQT
jgi:hypothetical protein